MDISYVSAIDFFSVTGKESFRIVVLLVVKYVLTCTCRSFVRMGATGVPGNHNFFETLCTLFIWKKKICQFNPPEILKAV